MTPEDTPGTENVGVVIYAKANGMVALRIVTLDENHNPAEVLQAIALSPEIARNCAQKLTLASWKAENGEGVADD